MNKIVLTILGGLLLAGISPAQDTTPQDSQTPATRPASPQMPEPSAAQPPSQQQQPESQPTPQQPANQPPAAGQTPAQAASQAGAATNQANGSPKIAPGSVIPAQLTKGVDAKKAKTGDEVVAKVTQDMKTASGEVLVPKDTKILGHVTEAQPRSKEQKESQVGIVFDHAVMKNGSEIQLPMSIQAIIGQQNNANAAGGSDQTSGGEYSSPGGRSGGSMAGSGSGRNLPMGGTTQQPTPTPSTGGSNAPGDTQTKEGGLPPISGQTQGVVGISNLKLSAAPTGSQGSVVSSEKNNVKLDSNMLLLLKVNQSQ
jgi:hypothetical protein